MTTTLKIDTRKFRRHVERVQWDKPALEYLRGSSSLLVKVINQSQHEDTRRFKRAFSQAARQIGANATMPALQPSEYAEFIRIKAYRDLKKWWKRSIEANRRVRVAKERLAKVQGRRSSPVTVSRALSSLKKQQDRAKRLLQRYEIANDKIKTIDRAIAQKKPVTAIGLRGKREVQIINKEYGGTGRLLRLGPKRWGVLLQNREPHARIVESRFGIVRVAHATVRSSAEYASLKAKYRADTARWWRRAS